MMTFSAIPAAAIEGRQAAMPFDAAEPGAGVAGARPAGSAGGAQPAEPAEDLIEINRRWWARSSRGRPRCAAYVEVATALRKTPCCASSRR